MPSYLPEPHNGLFPARIKQLERTKPPARS